MDAKDIEALAAAMIRQQGEAAAKAADDAAKVAAKQAEVDAKAAAEAAKVAAKQAKIDEENERVAKANQAKIESVLAAKVGDRFVDASGAEHRVVGVVTEGIDTVAVVGGVVGNWRAGGNVSALVDWKKV